MLYIIDSYAWIEYFIGSAKGEILKKLFLDERNIFFTLECCLAEITGWALKASQDFDNLFRIIRANSRIVSLTEYEWIGAGKERFEQKRRVKNFGLIDAVLLVKQKELQSTIITGDIHFKNMKKILFLE